MADWRKTKCCGTCALFDLDATRNAAGAVRKHLAARCLWVSVEPYPDALGSHQRRPEPGWTLLAYGERCPCYVPRDQSSGRPSQDNQGHEESGLWPNRKW